MKQKGFTLIEVLVAAAIFIFLSTLVSINIFNAPQRVSLNSEISTLTSDVRNQQLSAMTGGTDNAVISDFGVYLESNKYTLFSGSSYQQGKSDNSVFTLSDNIQISNITFPSSVIVFKKGYGEIDNFADGSNSFRLSNSLTGEYKTVTFNKLGVITSVQ